MTDKAASPVLNAGQLELLRRTEDLTWRKIVGRGVSYRLYSTEYDYETVTPRVARLIERGLLERCPGWRYDMGGIELTPAGRSALDNTDSPGDRRV